MDHPQLFRSLERVARRSGPVSDSTSPSVLAWRTERLRYFNLVRRRRLEFWMACVAADQSQPCRLWRSFDQLLGRGRAPPRSIDASVLHQFFDDKVAVCAATANAAAPQYTAAPVGYERRLFTPVTPTEVSEMVRALPDKQCLSDSMLTHVLKSSVDILGPFLSRLFCWSLKHGAVPLKMKAAHITPTLKKADLDPADAKLYRLIANLSVLSKLLERLVAEQLLTSQGQQPSTRLAVCIQGAPLDGNGPRSGSWLTSCWLWTLAIWQY